jgi:nucleotide-binding universal stress UspA family protein
MKDERPVILHPTDFSACSEVAETHAVRLALALRLDLLLLHVLLEAPLYAEGMLSGANVEAFYAACRKWAEEQLEAKATTLRERGIDVRWMTRPGVPAEAIVAVAAGESAELIVIGTHGRGPFNRFLLGSVADRVIRTAACPVLTVRGAAGE